MMAKYDQFNPPSMKKLLAPPIMQACLKAERRRPIQTSRRCWSR
jgi:hypothetical protein